MLYLIIFFLFFVSGMCNIIHSIVNRPVLPSQREWVLYRFKIFLKFSINRISRSLLYHNLSISTRRAIPRIRCLKWRVSEHGIKKDLPAYKRFRCGYTVENILAPEIEGAVVAASIQIRETFPLYEVVPMRSLIRLQCDTEDVNCVRIELPLQLFPFLFLRTFGTNRCIDSHRGSAH